MTSLADLKDVYQALDSQPSAQAVWFDLSSSHQREYITWITSAKKPETRAKRILKMIDQLLKKR